MGDTIFAVLKDEDSGLYVGEKNTSVKSASSALVLRFPSETPTDIPAKIGVVSKVNNPFFKKLFTVNYVCNDCNEENGFCDGERCQCKKDYFGAECNDTCTPACVNGTCDGKTLKCKCNSGWKGDACDQENKTSYAWAYIVGFLIAAGFLGVAIYYGSKAYPKSMLHRGENSNDMNISSMEKINTAMTQYMNSRQTDMVVDRNMQDLGESIGCHKDRKEMSSCQQECLEDLKSKERNIIREELWQQKRLGSGSLNISEQERENIRRNALLSRSDMSCEWTRSDFSVDSSDINKEAPDYDMFMDDYATPQMYPKSDREERYQNSVKIIKQTAPTNSYAHKSLKTV